MALVVFGESKLRGPIGFRREFLQVRLEQVLLEQLLADPQRQGHAERGKSGRREHQIRFEQAFEFQERLVVKHHRVQLGGVQSACFQAIADGMRGETRVVLFAAEALFLGRGHDLAIHHQRGRAVVIERRDTQNFHGLKTGCR